MKKLHKFTKILALMVLILGTVSMVRIEMRVITTGVKLIVIHDKIDYYNSIQSKTTEMTVLIEKEFARREKLYTSKDTVVRFYSNLSKLWKFTGMILSVVGLLLIPIMWLQIIAEICYRYRQKRNKRKKRVR